MTVAKASPPTTAVPALAFDYVLDNKDYDDNNPDIGPPIRIDGAELSYYTSLQAAYDDASDGAMIQVIGVVFVEDVYIDMNNLNTVFGTILAPMIPLLEEEAEQIRDDAITYKLSLYFLR